jgi:hypothetical protein
MDAPNRGALMLVWCIAGSLIVISVVNIGLYLVVCLMPKEPIPLKFFPFVLKSLPAIFAIVIFVKSKSLAHWISEKLDL